jgi:hypothetical protein
METNVSWYLENRIILVHISGDKTIEDFQQVNEAITQYLEKGVAPVHLLIDVTEMGSIPSNILKVKQAFTYLDHPSIGWSFFIGHLNAMENLIIAVTTQLSGLDVKTVDTLEEALKILNHVDLSINDLVNAD